MELDFYLLMKLGGIAVLVFCGGQAVSKQLSIRPTRAFVINFLAVAAGYLGSTLWYMIQNGEYWGVTGSVLYGWILAGTAAVFVLTRAQKLPFIRYTDALAPWMLLTQFMNRLGCFDAGCCYGKLSSRGLIYPVQLFEAAFDLALFIFLLLKPKKKGQVTLYYFTAYPIARFFLEFLRGDNQPALWFMTVPQVTSIFILLVIISLRKRITTP